MSAKKAPVHLTRDQILDYLWKWAPEKISATNKTAPHLVAMLPSEDGSFKSVELNRLTITAAAGYYLRFRMLRKSKPKESPGRVTDCRGIPQPAESEGKTLTESCSNNCPRHDWVPLGEKRQVCARCWLMWNIWDESSEEAEARGLRAVRKESP